MRALYNLLVRIVAPLAFISLLWRGFWDRGYWMGLRERFGRGAGARPRDAGLDRAPAPPCIWLHAVSLGEVSAAATLIRALRARCPNNPLVLTTATPTGRARAQSLFGEAVTVRYLPYDTPGAVRRFLGNINPLIAIVMETEIWPNLFHECGRRGVPLILASARISEKSVGRYRRFGGFFPDIFANIAVIAVQTPEDAQRFEALGAPTERIHLVGNVKFDIRVDDAVVTRGLVIRERMLVNRPTWVAGSTHAGEEKKVLTAHALLRTEVPDALLLLAPRHPNRFDAIAQLLGRSGVEFVRRSADIAVTSDTKVMLVDSVGELLALYAAADVAFVGGSLVPVGGHNLLEPAALGLPVLTGPSSFNGQQMAQTLLHQGAALQVGSAEELGKTLQQLFADPDRRRRIGALGRRTVEFNRGSVSRLIELIGPMLKAGPMREDSPPARS